MYPFFLCVLPGEPLVWLPNWVSHKTLISLERMREQRDCADKEQSLRLQTLWWFSLPVSPPPIIVLIILEFPISSLGVQPVLYESLADSSALGKPNLCRFGSEVLHHMEPLILLRLIGKAAIGKYPHTRVTDGMVIGGWLYSPENNLLWSLSRSFSDPTMTCTSSSIHILHLLPVYSKFILSSSLFRFTFTHTGS